MEEEGDGEPHTPEEMLSAAPRSNDCDGRYQDLGWTTSFVAAATSPRGAHFSDVVPLSRFCGRNR